MRLAAAAWSACYAIEPSKRFVRPINLAVQKNSMFEKTYSQSLVRAQKSVRLLQDLDTPVTLCNY